MYFNIPCQFLFAVFFGSKGPAHYFCTPIWEGLAYSIMVVRQILVLFVLVRIQVGQRKSRNVKSLRLFLFP